MKKKIKNPTIDIGWREWIYLVDFKNFYLKDKIDKVATISALHATHIEEFNFKGVKYVKFRLYQSKSYKMIKNPVIGYKMIKNSFGKKQLIPLINISIKIGNNTIDTIITLTTRSRMTYPVLIGRSTLNNNYRINPRKSFLTGKLD